MLNKIGVENFRVFENFKELEIAPVTILTGPNNSGKSSLLKLLGLLQNNFSENNNISYLSFDGGNHNLGTFDNVCNWNSNSNVIKLLFDFPLSYFDEDFQLELTYCLDNEDGRLESFKIFNDNRDLWHIKDIDYHGHILNFDIDFLKSTINREIECYNLENYPQKFRDELVAEFGERFPNNKWQDYYIKDFPNLSKEEFKERALKNYKTEYDNSLNKKKTFFDYTDNDLINDAGYNTDSIIDLEKKHIIDLDITHDFDKNTDFIVELFSEDKIYDTQISWSFLDNLNYDFDEGIYANAGLNEFREIRNILFSNINKSIKELKFSISEFSFMSAVRGNKKRILENKSINEIDEIVKEFNQLNLDKSDIEFLNKSMSLLNINGKISIERIQGVASMIYLDQNQKLVSLSDLGYGYSQIIPILLKIVLINKNIDRENWEFINKEKIRPNPNRLNHPFPDYNKIIYPTLIIEEPEANLHPNLQSRLADIIVLANKTLGIHFILETHSEYFIRKLQYLTAKKELTQGKVNIYYFNSDEFVTKNEEKIKKINIDEFGGLSDSFGSGFFDEATELKFELLKLNRSQNN